MRTIFAADAGLIEKIPSVLAARTGGEARITAIYRGDERAPAGLPLVAGATVPGGRHAAVERRRRCHAGRPRSDTGRSRGEERQFLVFRLGEDEFGLPIEAVDEVARVPDQITRLPKTPKFLEGVVNLRGDVLPVVDQRRRFDMPALEEQGARRLVVVRTERHRAGLIVDAVSEVLRCSADDIEPAPDLTDEAVRLVHGVINLEKAGRIVLLLDPAELLTRAERGLLDAFQAETERRARVIKVLVVDDSALMRKLLGRIFATEADFEVQFARNGLEALELARDLPARRRHPRHPHAADGRPGLPRPHHGRASLSGRHGVVAHGGRRRRDASRRCAWARSTSSPSPTGAISLHIDELRAELVAKVRAAAARQDQVERPAEGARAAPHRRRRARRSGEPAARGPRRPRRPAPSGEGLVLVGTSTGGPPALEALLTPLPATFPGPS